MTNAVRVVVVHTGVVRTENHNGYPHRLVHNEKTPFAVVLWDTVAHKVTKIVKRYVSANGALAAARRVNV